MGFKTQFITIESKFNLFFSNHFQLLKNNYLNKPTKKKHKSPKSLFALFLFLNYRGLGKQGYQCQGMFF